MAAKNPWREVSPGRWEHDDHDVIVVAGETFARGKWHDTWQVVTTEKIESSHIELQNAKRSASHLGLFRPRKSPTTRGKHPTVQ